jgi:hypothetical protein
MRKTHSRPIEFFMDSQRARDDAFLDGLAMGFLRKRVSSAVNVMSGQYSIFLGSAGIGTFLDAERGPGVYFFMERLTMDADLALGIVRGFAGV